jgi:hypothetical protein
VNKKVLIAVIVGASLAAAAAMAVGGYFGI